MKNYSLVILAISALVTAANSAEYLIRIDNLCRSDLKVVERVENHALVIADNAQLNVLRQQNVPFRLLDQNPRDHLYLLVFPLGEERSIVARYGSVVDEYEDCLLLKTTRDRIAQLNNLKVELCQLNLEPVTMAPGSRLGEYDLKADSLIQRMVNAVSQDSIRASILRMQRMYTRYATHDSNRVVAVNWIANRLRSYGCDSVYLHSFSASYGRNPVGIRRGKIFTGWKRYCVIGGHLDCVPSSGYAPGADDNASGTTAALEAARVMKDFNFENTIRFIGFNAEEQGLIGSNAYATNARSQNDTILGVLNFDMIGYVASPGRDSMNTHYTTAVPGCSTFVCSFFQAIADTYTQLKIRRVRNTGTSGSSDHASFWQSGYVALLGIERVLCPGYHTIGDTIGPSGVNNLAFATQVIKTGVAALAKLAVPIHVGIDELPDNGVRPFLSIYPNPARAFKIFFQNERDADIDLAVYNSAGQCVKELVSERYQKGFHAIPWQGDDGGGRKLPVGVYFLRLETEEGTNARKLVVIN